MLLHALTVIAAAFGLFLIQPLMAKRILPVFGGTSAVWASCLIFYQTLLLAGYLYAHALAARLHRRAQVAVHLALCAAALAAIPLATAPLPSWDADSSTPAIVLTLLRSLGLPYLLLSSTSPLLQHWAAAAGAGSRVYRLFAWSNVSCAVALLAYPFALERFFPLSSTLNAWQWFTACVVALHAFCAIRMLRVPEPAAAAASRPASHSGMRWSWIWLAMLGSAMLIAVTNHLTQVVAPFPLLWVLPLLLYLLSFAIVFEGGLYRGSWGLPVGMAGLFAIVAAMVYLRLDRTMGLGIAVYCAGLFAACLMLHGELAARKPEPSGLTNFYVAMAAGGAMGTVVVSMMIPLLLTLPVDLPVVLALCGITGAFLAPRRRPLIEIAVAAAFVIAAVVPIEWAVFRSSTLASVRNFYGALRITQHPGSEGRPPIRYILHGIVNHGAQYVEGEWRRKPLTYFHEKTAAGMVLSRAAGPRRVGVIGLGAGTLAAYGREGDIYRFYEINPLVVDLATRYFAYLHDTGAKVEVVLGDARLMMEREQPQRYDVLAVDAFTGDAVPAHLLTREAFKVYLRHLNGDGTLLLHISNQFLDLAPAVEEISRSLGLRSTVVSTQGDPNTGASGAIWVMVERKPPSNPARPPRPSLLWTDDFSSLFTVLR